MMRATILVVDDEPMLLDLFQEALSGDYEVLVAKSITQAVELLQAQPVHAVVTDLNCGHGNGLDLLRWIQKHRPALLSTSLILSGALNPNTEGFEVPVITKPIDLAHLRATFSSMLDARREHEDIS